MLAATTDLPPPISLWNLRPSQFCLYHLCSGSTQTKQLQQPPSSLHAPATHKHGGTTFEQIHAAVAPLTDLALHYTKVWEWNPNFGERRSCHVSVCYCTVKLVKAGQTVNSGEIFKSGQRLVKQEGFNYKYWYFWMSLQIWTTWLKMAY